MVSDVYFPRINGVSTSISTFRKEFTSRGHKVTLICPSYAQSPEEPGIHRIPSRYLFFDPEDRMMRSRAALRLLPLSREQGIDLVHVHTPFVAHYLGLTFARRLNLPLVVTYHTYFEEYLAHYAPFLPAALLRFAARHFTRSQLSKVDAMVVPSSPMLEVLQGYGVCCRARVIPTGIPLAEFAEGDGERFRRQEGIEPDRPMLLFIGRVAHEKNIDFLLRMFPLVLRTLPEAVMVIAGEGPARGHLQKRAAELGLEGKVRFVGYLPRDGGLLDCYRAADCFVFASRTETQGLVLLEALGLGVPVVSTAVLGTRDILATGKGALVAEEIPEDFAAKVLKVLRSPSLRRRLGEEGRTYVRQWSSGEMAERMVEFYGQVLSGSLAGQEA
jgi:1,2-diacylglycerol 3-alpha-glucosyltransferase